MGNRKSWRRIAFAVAVALVATLTMSGHAIAQDGDVEQSGNEVTVTVAVTDGSTPRLGPAQSAPSNWPYTCKWYDTPTPDQVGGATLNLVAGRIYVLDCDPRPSSTAPPINQFELYDPADPVPGLTAETSLTLADFARNTLQPQPLGVGLSPQAEQITGVETWFWPLAPINTIQATASAGGLSVTVQARFQGTTFDVGEPGVDPIRCTTFLEWQPGRSDSPCSHTYFTEETGRTIEASTEWLFVWFDNAGQATPVFFGTATVVETTVVDVIDLEAVISRQG